MSHSMLNQRHSVQKQKPLVYVVAASTLHTAGAAAGKHQTGDVVPRNHPPM
jgi:hypothetical protein